MKKLSLLALVIGLFTTFIAAGCASGGEDGAPTEAEKNAMSNMETATGGRDAAGGSGAPSGGGAPETGVQDE